MKLSLHVTIQEYRRSDCIVMVIEVLHHSSDLIDWRSKIHCPIRYQMTLESEVNSIFKKLTHVCFVLIEKIFLGTNLKISLMPFDLLAHRVKPIYCQLDTFYILWYDNAVVIYRYIL
jgi:hypothetical protein